MQCPSCREEVVEGSVFCHKCGHRLDFDRQTFPAPPSDESPPSPPPAGAPGGAQRPRSLADQLRGAAEQPTALDEEPERELWQGGYSPKAMIGPWLLADALTILLIVVGAIWVRSGWLWLLIVAALVILWGYLLAVLAYRRLSVAYRLSTQRFVHQSGLLRRVTDRIEVIDMDDITCEQGLFERLVGVGTIRIISSDRSHPDLRLPGIADVRRVADLFDDVRRAERRRRGLHLESI